MIHHRKYKDRVRVTFTKREDGGLCAHCDAVPGFYLSGANAKDVFDDVAPLMETLLRDNAGIDVEVFPLRSAVYLVMERPGSIVPLEAADADSDATLIGDEIEYVIERRVA